MCQPFITMTPSLGAGQGTLPGFDFSTVPTVQGNTWELFYIQAHGKQLTGDNSHAFTKLAMLALGFAS